MVPPAAVCGQFEETFYWLSQQQAQIKEETMHLQCHHLDPEKDHGQFLARTLLPGCLGSAIQSMSGAGAMIGICHMFIGTFKDPNALPTL